MRSPSTPQPAEVLADYIQRGMMNMKQVNGVLSRCNCGFSFEDTGDLDEFKVSIEINAEDASLEVDLSEDHRNVR